MARSDAEKRARANLRSSRGKGKQRNTYDGGRDPTYTDSAPLFPDDPPQSDDDDDTAPSNLQPFDPVPLTEPSPPLLVLSSKKEAEFGPLGRAAAQKMYHELTVVLGFAWAPVSEEINELTKREVMNSATKNDIASSISWED